jgi:hypothetical protein
MYKIYILYILRNLHILYNILQVRYITASVTAQLWSSAIFQVDISSVCTSDFCSTQSQN